MPKIPNIQINKKQLSKTNNYCHHVYKMPTLISANQPAKQHGVYSKQAGYLISRLHAQIYHTSRVE